MADLTKTLGYPIHVTPLLPRDPSHREDARRMVRHGLADVLEWLGQDVGPAPGEPTHAYLAGGRAFVSAELAERIRAAAARS